MMGKTKVVVALTLLLLVVTGCGGGSSSLSRDGANIVLEEAYLEPDPNFRDRTDLVVVLKNIGQRAAVEVGGWLYFLDAGGKQIGWSQKLPSPASSNRYWGPGWAIEERYAPPDDLHSIEVFVYWDNASGVGGGKIGRAHV